MSLKNFTFGFYFRNNIIFEWHCWAAQKWSFLLRISSVKKARSAGNCRFDHIYWRHSWWKTSFFVQCLLCNERLSWKYNCIKIDTSVLPLEESRSISEIFQRKYGTKYRGNNIIKSNNCIKRTLMQVWKSPFMFAFI